MDALIARRDSDSVRQRCKRNNGAGIRDYCNFRSVERDCRLSMTERVSSPQRATAADDGGLNAPSLGVAREPIVPVTPGKSGRRAGYLLSWGILALAAGVYLAGVVLKPQFLIDMFPDIDRMLTQPQGKEQNRTATIAEVQKLRATLRDAQTEVSRLRRELGDRDARVKAAELRIAGLEKELASARGGGAATETSSIAPPAASTASVSPQAASSPKVAVADASSADAEASKRVLAGAIGAPKDATSSTPPAAGAPRSFELVNGAIVDAQGAPSVATAQPGAEVELPLPGRKPAVALKRKPTPIAQIVRPTIAIKPEPASAIETGSVAAGAAATTKSETKSTAESIRFGAPVVTRSASPVGIRLTAGPSVDALRLSWLMMSERYGADLGGLQPRYVVGNTPAAPYALIAGPFANNDEAQRTCGSLIAKGIPCSVDSYAGNAL
jgi:hypothetical protein